jgi:hypothetical protein
MISLNTFLWTYDQKLGVIPSRRDEQPPWKVVIEFSLQGLT